VRREVPVGVLFESAGSVLTLILAIALPILILAAVAFRLLQVLGSEMQAMRSSLAKLQARLKGIEQAILALRRDQHTDSDGSKDLNTHWREDAFYVGVAVNLFHFIPINKPPTTKNVLFWLLRWAFGSFASNDLLSVSAASAPIT
jgi:hypothetical protein